MAVPDTAGISHWWKHINYTSQRPQVKGICKMKLVLRFISRSGRHAKMNNAMRGLVQTATKPCSMGTNTARANNIKIHDRVPQKRSNCTNMLTCAEWHAIRNLFALHLNSFLVLLISARAQFNISFLQEWPKLSCSKYLTEARAHLQSQKRLASILTNLSHSDSVSLITHTKPRQDTGSRMSNQDHKHI